MKRRKVVFCAPTMDPLRRRHFSQCRKWDFVLEAVYTNIDTVTSSFILVAASEMGDKTQLLAFTLAAQYKKPWTIMAGILAATILNHALAAWGGLWVAQWFGAFWMAIILGVLFVAFSLWTLKPDEADEVSPVHRFGALLTTAGLFFLAEMGDKTQLATVALGAQFQSVWMVTLGTTLGMMVTDGLAVFVGDQMAHKVNMKYMRWFAASLFLAFGLVSFWSALTRPGGPGAFAY
jgi:putative Ca2+/H+ antiporter (TMEM165/GDT1 family)